MIIYYRVAKKKLEPFFFFLHTMHITPVRKANVHINDTYSKKVSNTTGLYCNISGRLIISETMVEQVSM